MERQESNRKERWLSPATGFAGGALAGLGLALGTLAYAYTATHPPRRRLRKTPEDYDLPYESVSFLSSDGLRLAAWFLPPPGMAPQAAIVVCHGYPMNRAEMLPHAKFLHEAGFAVLLFDFRAMGESAGEISSLGYHEVDDLRGALNYLQSRPDTEHLPVGVLGHSLGAAVAIMTAAQDTRIQAVVAESPYPDLHDAIEARFRFLLGPASKALAYPAQWWAKRWLDLRPRDVSPLRAVQEIGPRAVLIITGQRDLLARWTDVARIFGEAQEPRELWLLKRSGHARCLRDQPAAYAQRVTAFFRKYLGAR
jgi:pimeloyl-ACP methyl ester carboxylesterase